MVGAAKSPTALPDRYLYASEMELGQSPSCQRAAQPAASSTASAAAAIEAARRLKWQGPPLSDTWKASLESLGHLDLSQQQREHSNEAAKLFFAEDFDGAAFLWQRALFIARKQEASEDVTAALTSNIASACHFLGEFDEAIEVYAAAIRLFEKIDGERGRVGKWFDGELTHKRIKYIRQRMELAAGQQCPPTGEFLDGSGNTQQGGSEAYFKHERQVERDAALDFAY